MISTNQRGAANTIFTLIVLATSLIHMVHGLRLPANLRLPTGCMRLFTSTSNQGGEWMDVCASNPSIPLEFARRVQMVCLSDKYFKKLQLRPFYMLYNETLVNGIGTTRGRVLTTGSCINLVENSHPYVIRSVTQCVMDYGRKAENSGDTNVICGTNPIVDSRRKLLDASKARHGRRRHREGKPRRHHRRREVERFWSSRNETWSW